MGESELERIADDAVTLRTAMPNHSPYTRRMIRTVMVVTFVIVVVSILFMAQEVLLLIFAGALFAVFLSMPTDLLSKMTGLPRAIALFLVTTALLGLAALGAWFITPQVVVRGQMLMDSLMASSESLLSMVLPAYALDRMREETSGAAAQSLLNMIPDPLGLLGGATTLATGTIGVLVEVAIIIFIGIYFAANPGIYMRGFLRMFAMHRRARIRRVMLEIAITLRYWLLGQSVAMLVVGSCTFVGLSLLGVPLAGVLATIAGILTFVPYVGPILSSVPILLVAFSVSAELAVYTAIFYLILHSFEGYFLTPNVHARIVYLPAGVAIVVQVLMGVLTGGLGLVLATPLAAATMVVIKRFYVEDVLGDDFNDEARHGHLHGQRVQEAPPTLPGPAADMV
ncbi:AI-2E family transporter [Marinivivus vitaminiproducens]|uniref:AI-2E family transporter n=1 Tax=Marinivivus vitaminiproducens TaxID=3035935 RepID=UPI00279A21D4|nr:AI-2E family transporter [Geminicoccaceae bacterium SCSIO 64248]